MGKAVLGVVVLLADLVLLVMLVINGIRWGVYVKQKKDGQTIKRTVKRNGIYLLVGVCLFGILIFITQISVSTPKVKDSDGNTIDGSIAELKKVELNGHNEWISIRGENKDAPILLFLAGGPGGSQLAATRFSLGELEQHFVVVNWDQPGSGKSAGCMKTKDITVNTYIEDGIALTEYLQERFGQKKIYLVGESWGSALGIFLASRKPDYYAGVIGTGQMVAFKETETYDYQKAMEIAKEKGDNDFIKKLERQGEPPYYSGNIAMTSQTYYNYLSTYMMKNPEIKNGSYHTFRDMLASEYGLLDSVNYLLGLVRTFNVVYPQLYDIDLRKDYTKVEVPVYFFLGRHDINAPTAVAEDYYKLLNAPKKELVWFEHSGHSVWVNEPDLFVAETLRVFGQK
ncbi:MAG: alpha/beta hydrolase [bacterium]|nr:alpha/beta hydrolase [bacterium]